MRKCKVNGKWGKWERGPLKTDKQGTVTAETRGGVAIVIRTDSFKIKIKVLTSETLHQSATFTLYDGEFIPEIHLTVCYLSPNQEVTW